VASGGGLFRLGRKILINVAMQCAITGGADRGRGRVSLRPRELLCAPGGALAAAVGLARRVTANAPLAVRESRLVVLDTTHAPDADGGRRSQASSDLVVGSDDVREGVRAFVEKRLPVWTGR
jgi:enoyl-CoA hydratase